MADPLGKESPIFSHIQHSLVYNIHLFLKGSKKRKKSLIKKD